MQQVSSAVHEYKNSATQVFYCDKNVVFVMNMQDSVTQTIFIVETYKQKKASINAPP